MYELLADCSLNRLIIVNLFLNGSAERVMFLLQYHHDNYVIKCQP